MSTPWYVYLIIGVVGSLLLEVCDKFKIIKSKTLRVLIVIFVSSFIFMRVLFSHIGQNIQ